MFRFVAALIACVSASFAAAADLPRDARLGVVDAIAPHLSAGFGNATLAATAPTIRDEWKLGAVAQDEAIQRLAGLGYRASAATLPADLANVVRRGGALRTNAAGVRLDDAFARSLARWMRKQNLDGVVVLRSLAGPLEAGAPAQSGYGIARRGDGSVAYANLAPLLVHGTPPMIASAPLCLVSAPVDRALIEKPKTLAELAPLGPTLKDVLRKAVDGALVRAGVLSGDAACE